MKTRTRNPFSFRKTALATALAIGASPTMAQLVLEEVIVTAQKREASVQDIAATVNVVTGESVEKYAAFDFTALEQQTAGLSLTQPNARNNTISLRGVSVDPESGVAPGVDTYWNDAVVRPDAAFTVLYDLERVEVLRGPQGTLQGQTSPAGAINIITRRASLDEASGYTSISITDNDGTNLQAAYGGPVVEDVFALRVAAAYDMNGAAGTENVTTGLDSQEHKATSARLSALWDVSDTISAQLIYQYLDQEKDDPKAMLGSDPASGRPTLSDDDNTALGPSDNTADFDLDLVNLIVDWEVMDHAVTAVVGYQDSVKKAQTENDRANSIAAYDVDGAGMPTFQTSDTSTESISYELRLASQDADFWNYMVGVYYQDQNTATEFNANSLNTGSGIGFSTSGAIPVERNTFGVFTFNTIDLNDELQLEVGLRWSEYESFRRADVNFAGVNFLPAAFEPIRDVVINGFAANFPIIAVPDDKTSETEDAFTGSVTLRWDVLDDTSLYAAYSRGYRPSGISISPSPNVAFLPNGVDDLLHDEEESDAIELGFKSRLLDGAASLNGAVFYQQFDGYLGFVRGLQVVDGDGALQDIPGGLIYNGDANLYGVELEGQILISEQLSAGGAIAYTKTEWDGAEAPCNDRAPGEVLGSCDIDGESIGGEPEWSITLNSEYTIPMDSSEGYIRGLAKYTDERLNSDASAGIGDVSSEFEAYTNVDLFVGVRALDQMWDVSIWAKNLLNEDEIIFHEGSDQYDVFYSDSSYSQINTLRERTIGVTGRFNF